MMKWALGCVILGVSIGLIGGSFIAAVLFGIGLGVCHEGIHEMDD